MTTDQSKGDATPIAFTDFATAQAIAHLQAKGFAVLTPGRLRTVEVERILDMSQAPQDETGAGAFFTEWVLASARELAEAMVQAGVFVVGRKSGQPQSGPDLWVVGCTVVGPTPDTVQANHPPSKVRRLKPKTSKRVRQRNPAPVVPIKR